MTKRRAQAIATRNRIYAAAVELMDESGFESVTIEDISRKAEVSVGSFYHYFKSKNDIFIEIFRRADEYFEETVAPLMQFDKASEGSASDRGGNDDILLFFRHYALFNTSNGIEMVRHLYNSHNPLFLDDSRFMHALLLRLVAAGQSDGELNRDIPTQTLFEHLMLIARGVIHQWVLENGAFDLSERMALHIRLALGWPVVDKTSVDRQ